MKKTSHLLSGLEPLAEFKRAFEVAKLDVKLMHSVAKDHGATRMALLFIFLSSLAGALGSYVFPIEYGPVTYRPTLGESMFQAFEAFLMVLLLVYVLHFIADQIFGSKGEFEPLLRVVGYGYVIGLLNFLPVLNVLVGVWMLIILGKSLTVIKGLNSQQVVLTLLIVLFVFYSVYVFLVGQITDSNLFGGLYVAPY